MKFKGNTNGAGILTSPYFYLFKTLKMSTPKKNAFAFHAINGIIESMKETITLIDEGDGSHGLILSAALPNEVDAGKQLTTECVLWGDPRDIANMLHAACYHNKALASVVRNVAIRLASEAVAAEINARKKKTIIMPPNSGLTVAGAAAHRIDKAARKKGK